MYHVTVCEQVHFFFSTSRPERWNILARRNAILAILLSGTAKSDCRLRTASRSSGGASDRFDPGLIRISEDKLEPHTVS